MACPAARVSFCCGMCLTECCHGWIQQRNAKHGPTAIPSPHRGWQQYTLLLIILWVRLFAIVFIGGGTWFRSAPSGYLLLEKVPYLPLFCVIPLPNIATGFYLKKKEMVNEIAVHHSSLSSSVTAASVHSQFVTLAGEASEEGGVWSMSRCKKSLQFSEVVCRDSTGGLPFLPQPSPHGAPLLHFTSI